MLDVVKTKITEYSRKYEVDLAYITKNELWVYLRQAITLIAGLAISVAFARLASKEVFGQYNFILALLAIFSLISIPGLNASIMRSVARGYEGTYKKAVKISFLWSLLGIPALLGAGIYYYYSNNQTVGVCLMLSSIFFPLLHAPNIWDSFLQGKMRFDIRAKYGSIRAVVSAAAMITILFLNAKNLVIIFVTYLVSNTFLTCLLFLKSLKYIENSRRDDACVGYGYFMTAANIIGTIANNIDRILIGSLLGAQQLAVYAIAIAIPIKAKDLLKLGWNPLAPKLCQDEIKISVVLDKINRMKKKILLPLAIMVVGGSILYWFFIDDIILLLFGEKYAGSIPYSKILLLMIILSIPTAFLGTFAIAKKSKKAIIRGYYIFPFVKLLIMFGFIHAWGLIGAVWGLNLSMVVQMLLIGMGMGSEDSNYDKSFSRW